VEKKDEECVEVGRVRGKKRRDKRGQRFLGVQGVQAGAGNLLYLGGAVYGFGGEEIRGEWLHSN